MQLLQAHRLIFPAIFVVALLAILVPAIVLAQDEPAPANLPPNLVGVEPGDPAPPLEPKYQPPSDGKDSQARPAALGAPTGLKFVTTTCTSITMQWNDVFLAQSYRLDYKEASSSTWLFGGTVATSPTSKPSIKVSNLTRNTSYHFRAIAWLGGYGDPSPTVTVRTAVTVTITGTGAGSSSSKSAAESQASAAAIADFNSKVADHEGTVIGTVPTPSVSVSSSSSSESSPGTTQISRSATVWAASGAEAAAKAQAIAAYDTAAKAVSGYTSHTTPTVTATSLGTRDQTKQGSSSGTGTGTGSTESAAETAAESDAETASEDAATGSDPRDFSHSVTSRQSSADSWRSTVNVRASYLREISGSASGSGQGIAGSASAATAIARSNAESTAMAAAIAQPGINERGFSYTETDSSVSGPGPGDQYLARVSVSVSYTADVVASSNGSASRVASTASAAETAAEAAARADAQSNATGTNPHSFSFTVTSTSTSEASWSATVSVSSTYTYDVEESGYEATASGTASWTRTTVTWNATATASAQVRFNCPDENEQPTFDDGSTTFRSVSEDAATGTNIGSAVNATDPEGDTLTYGLTGTDASSFSIVTSSGQLRTSAALDADTKSSYSVTVRVRDSKDSDGNADTAWDDTISVTINVTKPTPPPTPDPDPTPSPTPTLPTITIAPKTDAMGDPIKSVVEGNDAQFTLTASRAASGLTVEVTVAQQGGYLASTLPSNCKTAQPTQLITCDVSISTVTRTGSLDLPTTDNDLDEEDGSITVTIQANTNHYIVGTPPKAKVTVNDNDLPAPTGLGGNGNIVDGNVKVWWNEVPDALHYIVRYRPVDCGTDFAPKLCKVEDTWLQLDPTTATSALISAGTGDTDKLKPNTLYEIRVRTVGKDNVAGPWSSDLDAYALYVTDDPLVNTSPLEGTRIGVYFFPRVAGNPIYAHWDKWTHPRPLIPYRVCIDPLNPDVNTKPPGVDIDAGTVDRIVESWTDALQEDKDANLLDIQRWYDALEEACVPAVPTAETSPFFPVGKQGILFADDNAMRRAHCSTLPTPQKACWRTDTLYTANWLRRFKFVDLPRMQGGTIMLRNAPTEGGDPATWNRDAIDGYGSCSLVEHVIAHEIGHMLGIGLPSRGFYDGHGMNIDFSIMSEYYPYIAEHCGPLRWDVAALMANYQSR